MTREEAKEHIKAVSKLAIDAGYDSDIVDACAMAVRALEQEQEQKTDTWSIKEVADALERHGLLVREQEQGRWETEKMGTFGKFYRCSECNELYHTKTNYCPNCGAKLVKDSQG